MANILYGVNGEGAGHSTRAKEVLTHLERRATKFTSPPSIAAYKI